MRRTFAVAAALWLPLVGASAIANGLSSGLDGYDEPYTWESESLSFGVSAGWLTGQSHEFVYDGDGNKISELIWDMEHAYALHADLGIRLTPALKLNARGTWAGGIDNHMEDYDWMGLEFGQADWTHRSIHDETELDHFARFDINLQYDVIHRESLIIGGLLGARFTGVQWSASGGDFVYTTDPSSTFRDDVFSMSDDILGITYEQTWSVVYAGVQALLQGPSWRVTGSLIGSPFAYGEDDDDHWLRSLNFESNFEPTKFVAASAEAAYLFGGHYQVFVNANGERYYNTDGDMKITDTSSGGSLSLDGDVSGGDHENFEVSLGFRVTN